jgi:hypothetical protein
MNDAHGVRSVIRELPSAGDKEEKYIFYKNRNWQVPKKLGMRFHKIGVGFLPSMIVMEDIVLIVPSFWMNPVEPIYETTRALCKSFALIARRRLRYFIIAFVKNMMSK